MLNLYSSVDSDIEKAPQHSLRFDSNDDLSTQKCKNISYSDMRRIRSNHRYKANNWNLLPYTLIAWKLKEYICMYCDVNIYIFIK